MRASAILSPYSLTTQQVGDLTALKLSIMILLSNKFNQVIFIEYCVYSRPIVVVEATALDTIYKVIAPELRFQLRQKIYI